MRLSDAVILVRVNNLIACALDVGDINIIRVIENSVSTIEFYRLFLTKSNGLC